MNIAMIHEGERLEVAYSDLVGVDLDRRITRAYPLSEVNMLYRISVLDLTLTPEDYWQGTCEAKVNARRRAYGLPEPEDTGTFFRPSARAGLAARRRAERGYL